MDAPLTPMPLLDRLQIVAALWCDSHEPPRSINQLARSAIGDNAWFDRIGPRGPSTGTLERFAAWLTEPANWPDGTVPEQAVEFAHVIGVPSTGSGPTEWADSGDAATGNIGAMSGPLDDARDERKPVAAGGRRKVA